MKLLTYFFSIIVSAALLLCVVSCQQPNEPAIQGAARQGAVIANQYIVVLNQNPLAGNSLARTYAAQQQEMKQYVVSFLKRYQLDANTLGHVYASALQGFVVRLTEAQADWLRSRPEVAFVEADNVSAMDTGEVIASGVGALATGQQVPWGINYVGGPTDYKGTAVAWIVDTGICLTHPDLNVDASRGFNALKTGPGAKSLGDDHDHGSHISGTIAAKNNTVGVIGIAAGATVIPIKVCTSPSSVVASDLIAGIDFVTANARAGDVVNLSLGVQASQAVDNSVMSLVNRGNIFVATSAGNVTNGNKDANKISPARVNAANFYTVSAHDDKGVFATISCSGNPPIDFAAPGVKILSCNHSGGYITISQGTTMSTAHVSGILLANGGKIYGKGTVTKDRDAIPDTKASRVP